MFQFIRQFFLVSLVVTTASHAEIAQEPLLNRLSSVSPNLVLILDTSGSMDGTEIYDIGDPDTSGNGPVGPGGVFAPMSPDVNKLYYDPRVRYSPRVRWDGTNEPLPNPTSGSWNVYFRNPSSSAALTELGAYRNPFAVPLAGTVVPGSTANYWNTVTTAITIFPKYLNRTDCSGATSCTAAEERQNHANWNLWYRSRGKMAKTGLSFAFRDVPTDSIRLGYGSVDELRNQARLAKGVSSFGSATKQNFYDWFNAVTFSGPTPNLMALNNVGVYYSRTDSDGPWATLPNPASNTVSLTTSPFGPGAGESPSTHASCRRSFAMLVTDGYWNGQVPNTAGNADSSNYTHMRESGVSETYPSIVNPPGNLHRDNYSNTMADLAMHYWGRDLRPDLVNRVPAITSPRVDNPSFWQNMSFYGVTLGLLGTLPRGAATISRLVQNDDSWPQPVANTPTTIDDMWHASVNGRGELINANNASELTDAIRSMMESISGMPQTLSGVAVSSSYLSNGTRKYKPEYVPGTWSGKLSAIELDPTTGRERTNPRIVHWQVESGVDPAGEPISTIPAHGARNIATWNGTAGVGFNAANSGLTPSLVNYLRGDSSQELRKPGGIYRNRSARLGDIVNSNPVFVKGNVDLQYENLLPEGAFPGYRTFYEAKAGRTNALLFVGANDGMLHAFRDSDGREVFAYVPQAVIPELYRLAEPTMRHRFFVDGPLAETDAYLNGAWRNVLLGTTGAGAKAVFALDVMEQSAMNASRVMWEVNTAKPEFAELGHVLSDVHAGLLPSGEWVAIFGNGYESASGFARLFVVDLRTGELLKDINTGVAGGNGLGGVRPVFDANRRLVGAYAGDLKGNLWKFNLTGARSEWGVAFNGAPLYAGEPARPITAPPTVLPHPLPAGGHVVAFGTGKFFENGDLTDLSPQRMFGIWDAQPFGSAATPPGATVSGLGSLVRQTVAVVPHEPGMPEYFTISTNAVVWGTGLTGVRGWYIDLPNSGQRLIYPMERLPGGGTFVLATTLSPVGASSPDVCVQTGSGMGWAYLINGVTGSGPTLRTMDTNGDGLIDEADAVVAGYVDLNDGRSNTITIQSSTLLQRLCVETSQANCVRIDIQCGQPGAAACATPRASGIKSRSWRQLYMR